MVRLKSARWVATMLVGIISIPYLGSAAVAAEKISINPIAQTVLLFPFDKAAGAKQAVATEMDQFLLDGLSANRKFNVVRYSDRLPSVQRAIVMQPEKKSGEEGNFSMDASAISRAVEIGKATSADMIIIGSYDKYQYTRDNGAVEIAATLKLVDTKNGKTIRTISATGRGNKPSPNAPGNEQSIASEAVKDAGRNIIEQITGRPYNDITPRATEQTVIEKKSKINWLPFLLLSLGVGLALGGSGGGTTGGSSGIDNPPAPPY